MAKVIDALAVVEHKKRLPCEAFFVDTNIIIDYKDPFSRSMNNVRLASLNVELSNILHYLKSHHFSFGTLSVAIEYYKYLQVGYYQTHTDKHFTTSDFKDLRENDIQFMAGWDLQIKSFRRVFNKHFPLRFDSLMPNDILRSFEGSKVDFGDHVLYNYVISCPEKIRCIFTNDGDFYSFQSDFFILTTNKKIIEKAKKENSLITL